MTFKISEHGPGPNWITPRACHCLFLLLASTDQLKNLRRINWRVSIWQLNKLAHFDSQYWSRVSHLNDQAYQIVSLRIKIGKISKKWMNSTNFRHRWNMFLPKKIEKIIFRKIKFLKKINFLDKNGFNFKIWFGSFLFWNWQKYFFSRTYLFVKVF